MADASIPSFTVSVVVPVHNRSDELAVLLDSLTRLSFDHQDYEIIVCDDGSSDDIQAVVGHVRDNLPREIGYLQQSQRGPGSARNLGLYQARGKFVAFTDSDCVVDPQWLTELVRAFTGPDVGIVGGAIRPHPQSPIVSQCSNWLMSTVWAGGARDPRSSISMDYCPRAGNLAVRSDLAQQCGGFPETRHGEDIEFSLRIRRLGATAVFAPSAVIFHNEKRSLSQIFSEAVLKGRARTRLWHRMRGFEFLHAVPALLVLYTLFLLLAALFLPSSWALFSAIPLFLYGVVNTLIGLQAGAVFRSWKAVVIAPCCAVLMHLGYGLGFLFGLPTMMTAVEPAAQSKNPDASGTSSQLAGPHSKPNPQTASSGVAKSRS